MQIDLEPSEYRRDNEKPGKAPPAHDWYDFAGGIIVAAIVVWIIASGRFADFKVWLGQLLFG